MIPKWVSHETLPGIISIKQVQRAKSIDEGMDYRQQATGAPGFCPADRQHTIKVGSAPESTGESE